MEFRLGIAVFKFSIFITSKGIVSAKFLSQRFALYYAIGFKLDGKLIEDESVGFSVVYRINSITDCY